VVIDNAILQNRKPLTAIKVVICLGALMEKSS